MFSLSCLAMEQSEIAHVANPSATARALAFRVMTTNVCHPAEIQRDPELCKKFAWSTRKDRIFRQILDESPDIVGFQEVRNEQGKSSVADIWETLGRHGYEVVSFRNNPSELSFINVIAYKTSKFYADRLHRWWVSSTPDRFSDDWGNGWGRVSLMLTLYPIILKKVRGQDIPSPDYDQKPVHIVNIHNGLKHAERMHANQILVERVQELVDKKSEGTVVVTGDFNCFPDDGGVEELQVLRDAGYQEALSELKTSDGVPVSGTFIGYSYDRFRSPKGKLGTQLDHIFIKSFSPDCAVRATSHVNLRKYDGRDMGATIEMGLLVGPDGTETRDEFCSDHAAGIADVEVLSRP
jgi:endonuclease/exonuclease/phosphatase family metal-dependent hydrolase